MLLPKTIEYTEQGIIIHTPPQDARLLDPTGNRIVELSIIGYRITHEPNFHINPIVCCKAEDAAYVETQIGPTI